MRYTQGAELRVPYLGMDEEGQTTRNWAVLTFRGNVDRRRIKRELRKWVKRSLGRHLHSMELRMVMKGRITDLASISASVPSEGVPTISAVGSPIDKDN